MKRCNSIMMLAVLGLLLAPHPAMAKKVYSPIVEEGELEFEYQLDLKQDSVPAIDNDAKHQFELEYGITDHWQSAVYGVFRKKPGDTFRYDQFKWENIYQLFEQGERWLDAGLYFEYILPADAAKADILEFKLLLEKQWRPTLHTLNLVLKKELGANAAQGTVAGYAWRSKWRLMPQLEPGFEAYGSLGPIANTLSPGEQNHLLGPVLFGKLAQRIEYEIGYLFGLTRGTENGSFKLVLGYEF